ncbi:MAG: (2Fe-2S)-binding protein [Acidimicrobiaceae bacterium]|nr:(2Fe-2S)-binding protein [Acidimicrobiaceae bacterium]MYG97891.1 (2Fe-2S)-binding protein [Acidimicrobiaceae bacterium]MYL03477.1 (2Fe-2S)-binding protein [Acidimicrobiaceae bacterium]
MTVRLVVNGERVKLEVPPTTRLIEVLRDHLGLTGTKEACGRGDCGACTVLVGDRAVPSCLVLSARVTEPVRTVEGIAPDASALREALADLGGLQCGYCTPGIVVRAHQLIAGINRGNPVDVRHALAGNFCRCTGYNGLVAAIDQVVATVAARDSTSRYSRDGDR